jgi:DNA-binding MarR family transcriptional regulator
MELDRLAAALDSFAAQHDDPTAVPLHHLRLFIEVGRLGGRCTYRQLQDTLNLNNSSVSRTVNALGAEHRRGRPGLGLLSLAPDPDEGRRNLVGLTPKGLALMRQLQTS